MRNLETEAKFTVSLSLSLFLCLSLPPTSPPSLSLSLFLSLSLSVSRSHRSQLKNQFILVRMSDGVFEIYNFPTHSSVDLLNL